MKLSMSNIAWSANHDQLMYSFLSAHGFTGLEIAPTRIFSDNPYDHLESAKDFSLGLQAQYGLSISSMQSIWYGRTENIFYSEQHRDTLFSYTEKAVRFAQVINCKNLVFGNPRNRSYVNVNDIPIAQAFFKKIGDLAHSYGTVIALEANPRYYNTNFINNTSEAFSFCRLLACQGLRVNVDIGTFIYNKEPLELLFNNVDLINHIHISEPELAPILQRDLHRQLKALPFEGYFSIEMKNNHNLDEVKSAAEYLAAVFLK